MNTTFKRSPNKCSNVVNSSGHEKSNRKSRQFELEDFFVQFFRNNKIGSFQEIRSDKKLQVLSFELAFTGHNADVMKEFVKIGLAESWILDDHLFRFLHPFPLHDAKNENAVLFCLENGISVDAIDHLNETALTSELRNDRPNLSIVRFLLSNGAKLENTLKHSIRLDVR